VTRIKIPAADIAARILTIFCLCLLIPTVASAESVAATLTQWGLMGTYAKDCSKPASPSNMYSSFVGRADGSAFQSRDFGVGNSSNDSIELEAATIELGGAIVLRTASSNKAQGSTQIMGPAGRATFSNKPREIGQIKGPDGRVRTMFNREVGGDYSVRDGKLVMTGADTPWYTSCK